MDAQQATARKNAGGGQRVLKQAGKNEEKLPG